MRQANPALTIIRKCGCGKIYMTLDYDEEYKPIRLHITLGKSGGCAGSHLNAIQSLLNLRIRDGGDLSVIFDKDDEYSLIHIRCPQIQPEQEEMGITPEADEKFNLSCSDTLSKGLRYLLEKLTNYKDEETKQKEKKKK